MYKVLVDIDGVLIDLHSELEKKVREKYTDFSMKDVVTYNFNKTRGKSLDTERSYILKLLNEPSVFANAQPYLAGVEALKKLMDFPNVQVTIASLAGSYSRNTLEIAGIKMRQMKELFGSSNYSLDIIIGDTKSIYKVDYVIDDSMEYLEKYLSNSNTKGYLVNKSYNTEIFYPSSKGVSRVESLEDAVNEITKDIEGYTLCKEGECKL